MSVNSNALERRLKKRASLTDTNLLLIITIIVFIVMYLCAVVFLKKGFTKPQMFFNILNENASLLVLSCGMTLVMITGGIDISVGQVTCLVCMACAVHLQKVNDGVINGSVFTSLLIAIAIGLAFGIVQGFLVAYMEFQPFIVTLAGLFFGHIQIHSGHSFKGHICKDFCKVVGQLVADVVGHLADMLAQ